LHIVECFLRPFEILGVCKCNPMVPVEVIVIGHKTLDAGELNHDVLKLAGKKETGCHALAAGDGVSFSSACTDDLEQLLRYSDVLT
jgi:hypothetical protein